jgi:hypothetical protein
LTFYPSPGNIRYQLGATLSEIRNARIAGNLGLVADLLDLAITLACPKLTPEKETELRGVTKHAKELVADARRTRTREDDRLAEAALHDAVERALGDLLRAMSEKGIYAQSEAPPPGDASSLALGVETE